MEMATMSSAHLPTPQERLAITRKAIVRHMTRDDRTKARSDEQPYEIGEGYESNASASSFWPSAFARAVRTWWRHHPVSLAVDVATPVVGRYAKSHPFMLLFLAAAAGATLVVVRPWRLFSVGGVALAAIKSAAVPSVLMSLFFPPDPPTSNPSDPS
jgi:hypothetical protein